MIWLVILVLVAAAGVFGTIYLTAAIGRFAPLRRIRKKWVRRLVSLGLVAAGFAAVALTLSVVNAVIVFLHVLFLFLLSGIVFRILSSVTGKKFQIYWQGWTALFAAVAVLSAGYVLCHRVWQTEYRLSTEKHTEPVRIALIADSHLGTTFDGEGFALHLEKIQEQEPDIVLIAGDFVDDSSVRKDMITACEALGRIRAKYGVWFAYGNHDKGYFNSRDFTAEELAQELEKNHVHILEDESATVGDLCIVGRKDASSVGRRELSELLEGVDTGRYIIVLDHQPTDYEKEAETAADLVVSGHTHGGQLFPLGQISVWLGVNDRAYGAERRNGTDFIVTSGISDWAIAFKTGTRSEYVIIDVEPVEPPRSGG